MRVAVDGASGSVGSELSVAAEDFDRVAVEWDGLCDRVDASPWLRPGWFSCWWDAFGSGDQELLAVRSGERLVGVLPLMRTRTALISQANWHSPGFGAVAEDRAAEQMLIEAALKRAGGRARLDLSFICEDDPALPRFEAAAKQSGARTISRTIERSPVVELDGDWEAFEGRLPSKRRADLRRRRRRLDEQGDCRFDSEDGSDRLAELLDEGFAVEQAGWAGRDGTPIAARADTRVFYRRIAEWAAERGYLRLFYLRLDDAPIAFAYCLVDSDSLLVLKLGFHPSQARLAPGLLLTREMLAYAFESGFRTYDFLGQAEPYKMIWTDRCRDRRRVQAFPSTAVGLASYLAWKRGRPVAKWAMRARPEPIPG